MSTRVSRHYYKQNRMQQLRGFCYAVQTGSISKAAERMFLSQPSVSLQIQALERELGATLFERRGPRIRLTPDGETLYELGLPLVEGLDGLVAAFIARRGGLDSGELDIAAGESTILHLLADHMRRFTQSHPGIRIRFHNVPGREGLKLLRDDAVDFAVGAIPDVPEDIAYRPIYSFDEMLITPLEHPLTRLDEVTLEEISRYRFILPPRHLNTLDMVALAFHQHGLELQVHIEAGGWEVIKNYVEMGLGVSIVSGVCLTGTEQLAVRSLAQYFPKRSYGIELRRGKFLSPQAKRYIELLEPAPFTEASHNDHPTG
jgi:DNA-binding transcriptional LysR family regulator